MVLDMTAALFSRISLETFCSPAETACVRFYHPERKAGQLLQLCRGNECTCAEGETGPG